MESGNAHTITDRFIEHCLDSEQWFRKSKALRVGATSLFAEARSGIASLPSLEHPQFDFECLGLHVDTAIVAKMLLGLAVESALKGRLVQRHPELVPLKSTSDSGGNVLRIELRGKQNPFATHDLEFLADRGDALDATGDTELRGALRYLSKCVTWLAKYPVPKVARDGEEYGFRRLDWYQADLVETFLDRLYVEHLTARTGEAKE